MQNISSYIIYLIKVRIEKAPTGLEKLQVICLITMAMQLKVIFYQQTDFFYNMSLEAHD